MPKDSNSTAELYNCLIFAPINITELYTKLNIFLIKTDVRFEVLTEVDELYLMTCNTVYPTDS